MCICLCVHASPEFKWSYITGMITFPQKTHRLSTKSLEPVKERLPSSCDQRGTRDSSDNMEPPLPFVASQHSKVWPCPTAYIRRGAWRIRDETETWKSFLRMSSLPQGFMLKGAIQAAGEEKQSAVWPGCKTYKPQQWQAQQSIPSGAIVSLTSWGYPIGLKAYSMGGNPCLVL